MDVTIHLGKGEHFFFACFDGLRADVTSLTGVTDFCEIESLKPAYQKSDNIKITVKPLDCADYSDSEYCVDMAAKEIERPIIQVNSAFVNFNVTNEAVFENIEF